MTSSVEGSGHASMDPVRRVLDPATTTPPFSFAFNDFLRREYRFGLDPNRPLCKAFLQGHCPAGSACPDRHVPSSSFNKYVVLIEPTLCLLPTDFPNDSLVCKHWLRGLCKKGDACEFLHEFNLYGLPSSSSFGRAAKPAPAAECPSVTPFLVMDIA